MSEADARRHNQRLIQSLQPGDLVEFPRGAYSHWAVYVEMANGENDRILLPNQSIAARLWAILTGWNGTFSTIALQSEGKNVGNGKVIHRAGDDEDFASQSKSSFSMSGKMNNKATVREQNLLDVAGSTKARKNNQLDGTYRPLSRDEIVRRARSKIGEVGYNLVLANCEHFANWCRYDKAQSGQVQGVLGFPMQFS